MGCLSAYTYNINLIEDYFTKTLVGLSLVDNDADNYLKLKIKIFPFSIVSENIDEYKINLRSELSISAIEGFLNYFRKSLLNFEVTSEHGSKLGHVFFEKKGSNNYYNDETTKLTVKDNGFSISIISPWSNNNERISIIKNPTGYESISRREVTYMRFDNRDRGTTIYFDHTSNSSIELSYKDIMSTSEISKITAYKIKFKKNSIKSDSEREGYYGNETIVKEEDIAPKLQEFSKSGSELFNDTEGKIYDPNNKLKPELAGLTGDQVINNYINAIGGVKALKKIKDVTIQSGATLQGRPITFDSYYKAADKMLIQVGSGAMVFAKQIYNAGKGVSFSPMSGETKAIEGEELAGMKEASMIFPEMYYTSLGYTTELLSIEEQKDKTELYKVQVNKSGERKEIEYYDVKTGFKTRVESQGQLIEFSDYRAVDGIMFPYKITQRKGPMNATSVVSSVKLNSKLKDDFFEAK